MKAPENKWAKEVWNIGNEALCHKSFRSGDVVAGQRYVVTDVSPHWADDRVIGLGFAEHGDNRYNCNYFTKLPPLTRDEHDEFLIDLGFDLQVADTINMMLRSR